MKNKFFIFILVALFSLSGYGGYLINEINTSPIEKANTNPLLKNYQVSPINFLVMVKDNESSNTDSILCINFKPNVGKLSMLNIPRDTEVYNNGRRCKINNIYVQEQSGLATCRKVEELLGIKIQKYAVLDLKTIEKIVNKLGGIYFNVPVDMVYNDRSQNLKIRIKKGYQKLNGKKAVKVMRFRHKNKRAEASDEYNKYYGAGSDLNRISMQHLFIQAFLEQVINPTTIANLNDLIKIVLNDVETNVSYKDAIKYCSKAMNITKNPIKTFRLNGIDDVNGWYYKYDGQLLNTKSNELVLATKILNREFSLKETNSSNTNNNNNN